MGAPIGNKNAAGSRGGSKSILKGRVSTKYKKAVAKGLSKRGSSWNKVHKMQNSKSKSIKSRSANATRFAYLKKSYK